LFNCSTVVDRGQGASALGRKNAVHMIDRLVHRQSDELAETEVTDFPYFRIGSSSLI